MSLKKNYAESRSWGEALRRRRIMKNYTQEVVHIRTGLGNKAISDYERRGILPNVISAYKILEALDWTLEEWAKAAEEIKEDGSWFSSRFDWEYGYEKTIKGYDNDKG